MSSKHTHFTYEERLLLLQYISENKGARDIGRRMMKSPSTISKELQLNSYSKEKTLNSDLRCRHFKICDQRMRNCFHSCIRYEKETCVRLSQYPWICIGCPTYNTCTKTRVSYQPKKAQLRYENEIREARIGPYVSKEGIARINTITKKYVKEKKQPISHMITHQNLGISRSSLYRYVQHGYLKDIKAIDLPRKARYKPRAKLREKPTRVCPKAIRKGRTYADFLSYIENHEKASIVEMDSVIGNVGQSVLLTLLIRSSNFMIAFKRNSNDSYSVVKCFDYLKQKLGKADFLYLFNVLLGDRGSEFDHPELIEAFPHSKLVSHVFYCDPRQSQQKGKIEKNHEYIRLYVPQGKSFDSLDQKEIDIMMNHINSVRRETLGNKSPFEYLTKKENRIIKKLGYASVSPDNVILSLELFTKS